MYYISFNKKNLQPRSLTISMIATPQLGEICENNIDVDGGNE
jgi:hypothetical protein